MFYVNTVMTPCYRTPLSAKENDSLSNFCKGLSSSQPDLLKASDLTVTTPSVDIDVPPSPQTTNTLGRWNGSMSGLHLLSKQDQSSKLKASLSTASIHQRLQESKSRMNELANRISVISRSNTNLLDIGSVSPTHVPKLRPLTPCKQPKTAHDMSCREIDIGELSPQIKSHTDQDLSPAVDSYNQSELSDSDDVDDSAPLPVQKTETQSREVCKPNVRHPATSLESHTGKAIGFTHMSCSYIITRQIFPGKSYQNVGGGGCQRKVASTFVWLLKF